MFRGKRIAVVVPAYNEAKHIAGVVRGIPDWADQILVIDDGSVDGTARAAEGGSAAVRVLKHPRNLGVGAAIVTGYRAAVAAGADAVAVMGGDGQMSPDELASLVEPVVAGRVDYAKGDRTSHPQVTSRMPTWRRLGNAALSRWTGLLTGYPVKDAQCGYTVISASTLRRLPLGTMTEGYGYPNTLLMMLAATQARVLEVPVTPIYADEHSGLTPWRALKTHGRLMAGATWRHLVRPRAPVRPSRAARPT